MKSNRLATVAVDRGRSGTRISVAVPAGTTLADSFKLHDSLSDLLGKLGPRGCAPCLSGVDINIHEQWEELFTINLDTMQVVGG